MSSMRIDIITLFPNFFSVPLETSIIGRAVANKAIEFHVHNLRDCATDKHGTVDDTPYGGGPGMVLKVDVMKRAIDALLSNGPKDTDPFIILLTPQGEPLAQERSRNLASKQWLILICGHYEGFDERIRDYVDLELSIGPYVLSGGEPAALVVLDSVTRLLPSSTGNADSPEEESFSLKDESGALLLEYPHYTRPEEFDGKKVPEVLLSGNHAAIKTWRLEQAKHRTHNRPAS